MKKLKLLLVVLLGLMVTGCGQAEEKTMTCTRTLKQGSMSMDLEYTVTYKGDYVTKVKSVEKVTADDATVLDTYKSTVEELYKPYKDIKYYDTKVTIDGDTMTSTADINYEKIDMDKLVATDSAIGQLLTDGKIKVETMEEMYKQLGATCKK